jgi:hypothetical protein
VSAPAKREVHEAPIPPSFEGSVNARINELETVIRDALKALRYRPDCKNVNCLACFAARILESVEL